MLHTKSVHKHFEYKEQKRKKKKKEHKWGVAGDTTFITWNREASMSLTVSRQYPLFLVGIEIPKRRMKSDWKLIFPEACVITLSFLMFRRTQKKHERPAKPEFVRLNV